MIRKEAPGPTPEPTQKPTQQSARASTSGSHRPITLRTLGLGIAFGIALGLVWGEVLKKSPPPFHSFDNAKEQIQEHYLRDLDSAQLEQAAIQGMVSQLDEHSELLTPDAYQRLLQESQGSFVGIGLEIGLEDGYFTVLRVLEASPAAAQDIRPGDRIISVDDAPVKGKLLSELIRLLRGEKDTRVTVGFTRLNGIASGPNPFTLTLTRNKLQGAYLQTQGLDGDIAYLKATQCYDGLAQDLMKVVTSSTNPAVRGLILDLRNNPGGTLTCAVETADLFLNRGNIVTTATAANLAESDNTRPYPAELKAPLHSLPTVVLVNAGTASAAEIIAGALQDQNAATVIGSQTFGKGTVQTLLPPLPNGSAMKVTTAIYFTPKGRRFSEQGLVPDVLLQEDESAVTKALAILSQTKPAKDQKPQGDAS